MERDDFETRRKALLENVLYHCKKRGIRGVTKTIHFEPNPEMEEFFRLYREAEKQARNTVILASYAA